MTTVAARPFPRAILGAALSVTIALGLEVRGAAQNFVPATLASCDRFDLTDVHDIARINPEWAPIRLDAGHPLPNNVPNILEGFVAPVPATENQDSQASAEVSEEEIPWNHYTHDYTFKVVPDPNYQYLLSSWTRLSQDVTAQIAGSDATSAQACAVLGGTYIGSNTCRFATAETCPDGTTGAACHHENMEVEWENAAAMRVNGDAANDTRQWGSLPEYAWPSIGDRVWVEGRWIFDCGHPGVNDKLATADSLGLLPNGTTLTDYVKYESEVHPPRALVTFRLNHTAFSQEITANSGLPYRSASDDPSSWLPVTGTAVTANPPTLIPVTEADIFVSGNGGGANDLCSIVSRSDSSGDCSPYQHTGPVIPINNYNYVFDIYPPGAHYESLIGNGPPLEASGAIPVTPPVPDASLQWRIVDQSSHIPLHTCGPSLGDCISVTPIICAIGASTPPPPGDPIAQTSLGTTCPALQSGEKATRLRVILPFNGSNANFFAQSIVLGWDDVPDGAQRPAVRRFKVTLNQFTVNQNGRCTICGDGDWRVFVDVGGQWRWISWLYDTENGIYAFNGGDNVLNGDPLTENGDDDRYAFTRTPWIVDVVDGRNIHVAVGGYDSGLADGGCCSSYSGSDCDYSVWSAIGLGISDTFNAGRIGTYEFDLAPGDCASSCTNTIHETDGEREYTTTFHVEELAAPTPPAASLQIGDPHYANFVSSATPLTLSTAASGAQGFQYRFHQQGGALPTYPSGGLPFPVHWTSASLPANAHSTAVYLNGVSAIGDGAYDFQYSARSIWNLLEPRHAAVVTLDNTAPVTTINQPAAAQYTHADTLTLDYSVSDGAGSGVKTSTPTMDGSTTLPDGTPVTGSGQSILLLVLPLGTHTFSVSSTDNVDNSGSNSKAFSIVVTPESLKADVTMLLSGGCIDAGTAQSLIGKISAVQDAINRGQVQAAINVLASFISDVQVQLGRHISTSCVIGGHQINVAQILIGDAQYLQSTLQR